VFACGDPTKHLLPDEGLQSFIDYSKRTLGDDYFRTPRDSVIKFVELLSVLENDPSHDWRKALGKVETVKVAPSQSAEARTDIVPDEDDLVDFKL
jgi:hypothetical protein